jgi:hypothetical protein
MKFFVKIYKLKIDKLKIFFSLSSEFAAAVYSHDGVKSDYPRKANNCSLYF